MPTTDHRPSEPGLVALDWGTTNQRAWLLDRTGRVLDTRSSVGGLLNTTADLDPADPSARARAYADSFGTICGDWVAGRPDLPALACGMVGSAQGWVDAGYRTTPAALAPEPGDLVRAPHPGTAVWVVPGLRVAADGGRPGDVLRGEETQVLGVLDELPHLNAERTVLLPGTHTKWVRVTGSTVTGFTTTLTGELFGLEMAHGILGRTAGHGPHDDHRIRDDDAFLRGLDAAAGSRGLMVDLFGARALVLDGHLTPAALPDYVSGVLIGHEITGLLPEYAPDGGEVVVCGSPGLSRRYRTALATRGVRVREVPDDVVVRGLLSVAAAAGLLTPTEEVRCPN
ncbi:2-dehydro-3-deoxygalactonokinase [Pseudonocardia sp. NPDC049635]|uniref:2-dehydro-3-deoxygalactonokinase n=1 Tax=Pseudonocardia sp. NPDC049635 TaxID=3155506 RepID=UPI0033F4EB4F